MNLGQLIERNARLFGAQPAIVFEGRATTHREFRDRVVRLINALVALGAKHQDRIAILSQNRTEYLECYGAAELGGFVAVGVNYRLSAAEQLAVLGDCQPPCWCSRRSIASASKRFAACCRTCASFASTTHPPGRKRTETCSPVPMRMHPQRVPPTTTSSI